jgi:hypothetical protein
LSGITLRTMGEPQAWALHAALALAAAACIWTIIRQRGSPPTADARKGRRNALPFGLAAYAFTRSAGNADRLANDVEAGNLSINHFVASVAETPFGGAKDSGYGREGGTEGLACYTVAKNVSHKTM